MFIARKLIKIHDELFRKKKVKFLNGNKILAKFVGL